MKHVRKIVLFITIFSLILSTLGYASPIDTIIDTTPGTDNWDSYVASDTATPDEPIGDVLGALDQAGGWLWNIINTIIGVFFLKLVGPLWLLFPTDSISRIIFNYDPVTKLSFFNEHADAGIAPSLMDAVAPIYVAFRYIAIICYILIILYLSIRMLLSTVSKEKAKYKEMIKHWLTGVLILL